MNQRGLTLLELLIALAIGAALLVIGIVLFTPSAPRRAALDLQRLYLSARNRAIVHSQHIAVVPANGAFTRWQVKHVPSFRECGAGSVLLTTSLYGSAAIRVASTDAKQGTVVWMPNGAPRACNATLPNQTLHISGASATYKVVISNLGRVSIEAVQ